MTNLVDLPRLGGACVFALLLTALFVATVHADQAAHSKLIYGDGKEFQTEFYDAHLLGELTVQGKGPILVFSGRSSRCSLSDCDSKLSVYFQSASDGSNGWSGESLRYPGDYYATESRKLVARVRMFIGRCIDSREGVAWFIQNFESRPQKDSPLNSQVIFEYIDSGPPGSLLYGLRLSESPNHVNIAVARAAVSKNVCREIAPLPNIYRPVTQYVGMPMPNWDLMWNGSTPDRHFKQWIKYRIALPPNHPWPIVFFSPEEFQTTGAGNESLLAMNHPAYDHLTKFTRSQPCVQHTRHPSWHAGGEITEYDNGKTRICYLSPTDACSYLTAITTLPDIQWTAEHTKVIRGLSWDTQCKDSGWWEYQQEARRQAEMPEQSHSDDSKGDNRPAP
jgi:hypothetical protein